MWSLIMSFALTGLAPRVGGGLPAAPVDVVVGQQVVDLRQPLYARSPGAYLVLYVRDRSNLENPSGTVIEAFESAVPTGSVVARLNGPDADPLTLVHSEYSYYKGFAGIVLRAPEINTHGDLYNSLELDSKVDLKKVRVVWLNRGGARVEDLRPSL